MGCDPDWVECACVKGHKSMYHASDCSWTIKCREEEKRKKAEQEKTNHDAWEFLKSFMISSPDDIVFYSHELEELVREYYPKVQWNGGGLGMKLMWFASHSSDWGVTPGAFKRQYCK